MTPPLSRNFVKKIMRHLQITALLIGIVLVTTACENKAKTTVPMEEKTTGLNAVQFRIARPTNNLKAVVAFYKDALGLSELGSFAGHDGYDGVMLGLPDAQYHLEFTQHHSGTTLPEPTRENLLVLYYETPEKYRDAIQRMTDAGIQPVAPENPYWVGKSETYEDPDKWRVVLFNGIYKP